MFPIVDPGWYEAYWFNLEASRRHPRAVAAAWFALRCALAAAAVVALGRLRPHAV